MHNSVIITKGGFPKSGGSIKYPELMPEEGTELEVLDVPKSLYLKELSGPFSECISLIEENEEQKQILLDEKERLLKRIKDIDILLSKI